MIDDRPSSGLMAICLVVAGGVLAAVALVYVVLTSGGNSLSQLAKYVAGVAFVAGVVNPRAAMFPFIVATIYLDLLKRLLILYDRVGFMDLFFVLGIGPALLAGITGGTLAGIFFGKIRVDKRHWILLAVSVVYVGGMAAMAFRDEGLKDALKKVADTAAYSLLLFVIPALFRDWREIWRLLRFGLIAFLPAGFYAYYQHFRGLSAFEIEYLKSGLTIMVKELDDVRPRPFSTLNSAHSLAFLSSMLCSIAFVPLAVGRDHPEISRRRWLFALLGLFCFGVTFVTMARSGHIVWIAALAAVLAFSSRRLTIAVYGIGLALYGSLIVFAEWFMVKLPEWDSLLSKDSALMEQATRIQTYTDRLISFTALHDARNYSLFGVKHYVFTHEALSSMLVNYGLVVLLPVLIAAGWSLRWIHRELLHLPAGGTRRVVCLFFGVAMGVVTGEIMFGAVAGVFPINAYVWIMIGGTLVELFRQADLRRGAENEIDRRHHHPARPVLDGRGPFATALN
ncbi:MAG: hypothetical protein H7A52_16690 [Akkermansiaceae bacterium]|nr:hypothetical protein [Akkermansiaceae bacterium]